MSILAPAGTVPSIPNSTEFVRNAWYVAAPSKDIGENLVGRRILDEPIVVYRTDSEPVALFDACAHRRFPLSRSQRVGDKIRCAYHGWEYDATGACVHIPSADRIPKTAAVRKYPLVERYDMIWIWMGHPDEADPALIPDCSHFYSGRTTLEQINIGCHYQLLIENLLDFSHVPYVHHDQQGHSKLANVVPKAGVEDGAVVLTRSMPDTVVPPLWHNVMGLPLGSPMNHDQRFVYRAPGVVCVHQVISSIEHPEQRFSFSTNHFVTPDGLDKTHYTWVICLSWENVSDDVLRTMHVGAADVAAQDVVALELQQKNLQHLRAYQVPSPAISVPFDSGALLSRQVLKKLADVQVSTEG